ncbi:glycoside hydrolase family 3 N-terminal domain-containing protein, partial [Candidatus Cyanaurora vandensis]
VKHIPGHGDVDRDSHLELPVLSTPKTVLARDHWPPFQALIRAGVETAMVAHLQVPALDPMGCPASLSRPIVTDLLQTQWGFQGVVVTDALTMQAITDRYSPAEAALLAFQAGADILLMPPDLATVHRALETAVATGAITPARIAHSLQKIHRLKTSLRPPQPVAWADHRHGAQRLFAQSLQAVGLQPLPAQSEWVHVLVLPEGEAPTGPLLDLKPTVLTPASPVNHYPSAGVVFVHLMLTTGPYRSCTRLPPNLQTYLTTTSARCIVLSYGNPYLLQDLPPTQERLYAYSPQPEAQRAVIDFLGNFITLEHPI